MRISNWVFQTVEAMLIGIMSLCGTITLASSKLFTSFQQSVKLNVQELCHTYFNYWRFAFYNRGLFDYGQK